jgi:Putative DNA-binding domain
MSRPAPAWLADFQARFGSMLRTPLDRASGTLTAATAAYDPQLCAEALDGPLSRAAERLAVYNRQYWFRLFSVLHAGFPLTARLMGYWDLNAVAARYLLAHPPGGWDIEQIADGFRPFFEDALGESAPDWRLALLESVRIDAAHREVFRAERLPPFRPLASDAADLLTGQLVPLPALRIVEEHRPLLALRTALLANPSSATVDLPPLLTRPQAWAIIRREAGTARIPIEAREAELLTLMGRHSVGDALARLESSCPAEERSDLPDQVRAWLARSIELGFWCSFRRNS